MSKAEFTPGKRYIENLGCGFAVSYGLPNSTEGATFQGENGYANALLDAAAPELYEVVESFVAEWDKGTVENKTKIADMFKHVLNGRSALAKARGEAT